MDLIDIDAPAVEAAAQKLPGETRVFTADIADAVAVSTAFEQIELGGQTDVSRPDFDLDRTSRSPLGGRRRRKGGI